MNKAFPFNFTQLNQFLPSALAHILAELSTFIESKPTTLVLFNPDDDESASKINSNLKQITEFFQKTIKDLEKLVNTNIKEAQKLVQPLITGLKKCHADFVQFKAEINQNRDCQQVAGIFPVLVAGHK